MNGLAVALYTYNRVDYSLATISSMANVGNVELAWYVADAGSPDGSHGKVLAALRGKRLVGHHHEELSAGENWNKALQACYELGYDVVLHLENDWALRDVSLRFQDWMLLLEELDNVGLIRLGTLAIGNRVEVKGHRGQHYLEYHRSAQYAYSGNPGIHHRRFHNHYGYYATGLTPGDTEVEFDGRFCATPGPEVWRPVDIGGWGAFGHFGTERSY